MEVPVLRPLLPNADSVMPYLRSIDQVRIYTNGGPLLKLLESRYADRFGVEPEQVIAVANATLALEGAISVLPPKKWIVPNFTFAATGLAVLNAGKELVLSDVSEMTWELDIGNILEPKQDHTRLGLMPVMPFGAPVSFEKWKGFPYIVFDAAASLGTSKSLENMEPGWIVVHSLHATKILGAGEGAIVITGSKDISQKIRQWLNFGFNDFRDAEIVGTNAKLSEFHAAYALSSLDSEFDEFSDWQRVLHDIQFNSKDLRMNIGVPKFEGIRPYWIVQLPTEIKRDQLASELRQHGIGTRVWWGRALSEQKAFYKSSKIGTLGVSQSLASTHLGLPCFRDLSTDEIIRISRLLKDFEDRSMDGDL